MDMPAACEIDRLPEDLLEHVIALTSPGDAFRATAVSRAFHAAAESDTVWSRFLPNDLPRFAKNEIPRRPPSTTKGLFRRLADEPVLLRHKYMRMQLDKATGAKCFTLSSSALQPPAYSTLVPVGSDFDYSKRGKRFLQAIRIPYYLPGPDIRAKVHRNMLSRNTTYGAYMVFKLLDDRSYGLDLPLHEASFGMAGRESIRKVCLYGYAEDGGGAAGEPPRKLILPSWYPTRCDAIPPMYDDVHFPRKKTHGWMEVELGEFHNEEGDGVVSISLIHTSDARPTVIVWGIELRTI
ncbi:hypothetical protein QYE76_026690 [Lolium multiflorum]|uniref:F-box domain-containing protein n=1 Tax=Lolium multiflorum TaxID=4521 RepID=A0AAD8RGG3_LOLMU|nr:hypothetical protein QYE76_026690 [Lolium multiflorum]